MDAGEVFAQDARRMQAQTRSGHAVQPQVSKPIQAAPKAAPQKMSVPAAPSAKPVQKVAAQTAPQPAAIQPVKTAQSAAPNRALQASTYGMGANLAHRPLPSRSVSHPALAHIAGGGYADIQSA